MKKILSLLLLGFASAAFAGTGDALSVMNAFLATFAKDNVAWKTDITLTKDPQHVASGRQLGYSSLVGYYTFLPKTWDQLTEAQKQDVYGDARLKSFIVSLRNPQNYPALTSTETSVPAQASYPVEGYASAAGIAALSQPTMAACQAYMPSAMPVQSPMYNPGYGYPTSPAAYGAQTLPMAQPAYGLPQTGIFGQSSMVPSAPATTYYFPVTIGGVIPQAITTPTAAPLPVRPVAQGVPYYMPTTLSSSLSSPMPYYMAQPQPTRVAVTPEEMLLARPMSVYMQ